MNPTTVTCITCDADGPGVGDYGYLGTPDLSTTVAEDADSEDLPFGYLYEPLQAICLRPRDLEGMHAFLKEHEGHHLSMWNGAQDEEEWPEELRALLSRREQRAEAGEDDGDADDVVCVAGREGSEWAFAQYGIHCLRCDEEYIAEIPEDLRAFDALSLTPEAVDLMLARWGKVAPDDGWNYRLGPAVDPFGEFMEGLLEFLRQHRRHSLEARLHVVG